MVVPGSAIRAGAQEDFPILPVGQRLAVYLLEEVAVRIRLVPPG